MARAKNKAQTVNETRRSPLRRLFAWLFYWPRRLFAYALAGAILWVGAYTVINPPGSYYMATEWVRLGEPTVICGAGGMVGLENTPYGVLQVGSFPDSAPVIGYFAMAMCDTHSPGSMKSDKRIALKWRMQSSWKT